jgi:hypothetical protein
LSEVLAHATSTKTQKKDICLSQEWVVRTLRRKNGTKMDCRVKVDPENQVCLTVIISAQDDPELFL